MDNKRHLKKFENQNAYDTQKDELMGIPHVVLFEDTKKLVYASKDPFNGHEYVDLGLPSGTLWATSVIGGDNPLYFAWGDTEGATKEQIESGEFLFGADDNGNVGSLVQYMPDVSTLTKYNSEDGKTVLDLEDDVVNVHMGGDWHIPTYEQLTELTENTTSTWTTQNGVNGRLFTSNINGESVFVPAFGIVDVDGLYDVGSYGSVWSSSISADSLRRAYYLYFDSSLSDFGTNMRTDGCCVIGVVG